MALERDRQVFIGKTNTKCKLADTYLNYLRNMNGQLPHFQCRYLAEHFIDRLVGLTVLKAW